MSVTMAGMEFTPPTLLPIGPTARRLHVTVRWLRGEAAANRVPHLKAEDRLLFDPDAVERALVERARERKGGGADE